MEAKIKALELMQRFNEPTQQWDEVDGFMPHKHNAKTCALIAVDTVLSMASHWATIQYWNDVKQEIENL